MLFLLDLCSKLPSCQIVLIKYYSNIEMTTNFVLLAVTNTLLDMTFGMGGMGIDRFLSKSFFMVSESHRIATLFSSKKNIDLSLLQK